VLFQASPESSNVPLPPALTARPARPSARSRAPRRPRRPGGDQPPVAYSLRVPRAQRQSSLPLTKVVAGEAIPAANEQFCPICLNVRERGGIRFLRFFARIIGATGFPKFLAGLRVQGQKNESMGRRAPSPMDRHIALEDLQIKAAAVKGRAAGEGH